MPIEPAGQHWLFGPWLDLLVGCGLGYVALVPILLAWGSAADVHSWPAAVVTACALAINGPHYGATVLRAYSRREDRAKYRLFTVYATLFVIAAFAMAAQGGIAASLLITAYLTWSPWHFSGQNYGIGLMFLRRRGVVVDAGLKRLFWLSFALSALLAMIQIHGTSGEFLELRPTVDASGAPRLLKLGLHGAAFQALCGIVGTAYVACLLAIALRLRRSVPLADQAPMWALVVTQALWFVIPVVLADAEALLPFAAMWVSTAHSVQYLWITAYYAKRSDAQEPEGRFLLQSFFVGTSISVIPSLLFAPDRLGRIPWDAGLAMVTFSAVNLHHFILDGAIWKLRDGAIARALLRPAPPDAGGQPLRSSGTRRFVLGAATLSALVPLISVYEGYAIDRTPTPERIDLAVQRLRWLGRESVRLHLAAGQRNEKESRPEAAIAHYRRSLELFPTAEAWSGLGRLYAQAGKREDALAAYHESAALMPNSPETWLQCVQLELSLAREAKDSRPHLERAASALRRVVELDPRRSDAARQLAQIERRLAATSAEMR